jgi:hypothetical protein
MTMVEATEIVTAKATEMARATVAIAMSTIVK